jgi:tetratricopeptide (TPR) repeat protein
MSPGNASRLIVTLATLVSCLVLARPSAAQVDADKKPAAKEHYEKATRFYDVGKYGEAIAEYEQSYLLIDDPALLFNIGQAYRLWDHPEEAIRSYKNYLRRRPDAGNRADVERKITDLERVVEERHRASAPSAPQPAPAPTEPGPPADAAPPQAMDRASAAQPMQSPGIEPGPMVTAPAPEHPIGVDLSQPAPVETQPHKSRLLPYTLIGVGGVCLLTSLVAAAAGASQAKKLQDASQNHDVYDPKIQSSGKAANALAFVAGLGALTSGGIGGYLLWRARQAEQSAQISALVAPGFAGAELSLSY